MGSNLDTDQGPKTQGVPVSRAGAAERWPDGHVNKPDKYWEDMEARRLVPRGLRSEFDFLEHGMLYKMPQETAGDFRRRQTLLQLPPFYWGACALAASQPYNVPCNIEASNSAIMEMLAEDPSGTGEDLCSMARRVALHSMGYGIEHLLVRRDEQLDRVVIEQVPSRAIIGTPVNGAPLRMRSSRTEVASGSFEAEVVPQVHVYRAGSGGDSAELAIYEPVSKEKINDKWVVREGPFPLGTSDIPVVPVPTGTDGPSSSMLPWVIYPPSLRLANLNMIYVNKLSDRDRQIYYAASPQVCGRKITESELKAIKGGGPGVIWTSTNGEFYWLETSGEALSATAEDLAMMARQMEAIGNQPMVDRATGPAVTATGEIRDETRGRLLGQSYAVQWDSSWTRAAMLFEELSGIASPSASIASDHDFGPLEQDAKSIELIRADWLAGKVDDEFYFQSMVDLGGYPPGTDVEERVEYLRSENRSRPRIASATPFVPSGAPQDEGAQDAS